MTRSRRFRSARHQVLASRPMLALPFVAGLLLLGACGGDGESAGAGEGERGGEATSGEGPNGTEPPADEGDADAVRPYVEELLADYDDVANQIVAEPAVARDPDDVLIQQYLHLFEPDSQFAEELIGVWVQRADEGLSTRPFDDENPTSRSRLDGDIEVRSPDEVSVPICVERSFRVFDAEGRLQQRTPHREQPGEVVAVRVDGEWRLRELTTIADTVTCGPGEHEERDQS